MNTQDSPNVLEAKRVLHGKRETVRGMWQLTKALQRERAFGFARRILQERVLENRPIKEELFDNASYPHDRLTENLLAQQHALCTYKDQGLLPTASITPSRSSTRLKTSAIRRKRESRR